jgi:hypothetical protein
MRQRCQKALRALEDIDLVTPSNSPMHNGLPRGSLVHADVAGVLQMLCRAADIEAVQLT